MSKDNLPLNTTQCAGKLIIKEDQCVFVDNL